jgi:hypothetical protein
MGLSNSQISIILVWHWKPENFSETFEEERRRGTPSCQVAIKLPSCQVATCDVPPSLGGGFGGWMGGVRRENPTPSPLHPSQNNSGKIFFHLQKKS